MLESMLKICLYTGINADVTLEDNGQRTECEDRARILKQNSQYCQAANSQVRPLTWSSKWVGNLTTVLPVKCLPIYPGNTGTIELAWLHYYYYDIKSHFYQKIWDTVILGILGLRVLGWFFLLTSKSGLRNTCPDQTPEYICCFFRFSLKKKQELLEVWPTVLK